MYSIPDTAFRTEKREEYLKQNALTYIPLGKTLLSKTVDCYKIGRGKRSILAVGAHHALEYITASSLYAFIDFLLENSTRPRTYFGTSPDFILKLYSFYIVPALNCDGIEMHLHPKEKNVLSERQRRLDFGEGFTRWQANARGVDLNHNYGFGFDEYKRIEEKEGIEPGRTRYSGEYPESEPETRALANFVRIIKPCAAVSFHTQGREIFYSPQSARTERIAKSLASLVTYRLAERDGHNSYGGFCDYTGFSLGIPSFTVELGKGKNPLPPSALGEAVYVTRKILLSLPSLL